MELRFRHKIMANGKRAVPKVWIMFGRHGVSSPAEIRGLRWLTLQSIVYHVLQGRPFKNQVLKIINMYMNSMTDATERNAPGTHFHSPSLLHFTSFFSCSYRRTSYESNPYIHASPSAWAFLGWRILSPYHRMNRRRFLAKRVVLSPGEQLVPAAIGITTDHWPEAQR